MHPLFSAATLAAVCAGLLAAGAERHHVAYRVSPISTAALPAAGSQPLGFVASESAEPARRVEAPKAEAGTSWHRAPNLTDF
jgi:hypothetical protein